jgi:hypothetical protein
MVGARIPDDSTLRDGVLVLFELSEIDAPEKLRFGWTKIRRAGQPCQNPDCRSEIEVIKMTDVRCIAVSLRGRLFGRWSGLN